MNETTPAVPVVPSRSFRVRTFVVAVSIAISCAVPATGLGAPDLPGAGQHAAVYQNVDYIGAGSGAALDLGFPVLVPAWVPAPFGGEPSIDAGGGYYSLYWMNGGGDPTFLHVTGEVGGSLPAGSPYDLNIELFINASVQGYGAIHDVTPAYDAVWWQAGGVLYKVESRNSSTDSLSLANSLIAFQAPSAPEPEPTEPPVVDEPEPTLPPVVEEPVEPDPVVEEPEPSDTGDDGGDSGTSDSGADTANDPGLSEAAQDAETASEQDAAESGDGSGGADDGTSTETGETDSTFTEPEETPEPVVYSDGTGGPFGTSDGTGGARIRVTGSDGTGGTSEVVVPPAPSQDAPTP